MLFLHPRQHLLSAVPVWFCANQDTHHISAGTGGATEGILGFLETWVRPGPAGIWEQRPSLWNRLHSHPPAQYFEKKKTYIKQRKQSVNPTMHCCKVSTWMKTPAWLCQLHHPLLLRWRRWWKRHWTCLRWQSHAARDALETHARVRRASAGRKWCRSPAATPRSSP